MQWIKEPVPFTGYYEQMLALDKREAALLARILQKPLKELRKRLERLYLWKSPIRRAAAICRLAEKCAHQRRGSSPAIAGIRC